MKQFFLSCCFLLTLVCGCSLLPEAGYREPAYYDLNVLEEKSSVPLQLSLNFFSDLTGNGTRMVTRSGSGTLSFDEMNRFSAPPVQLIKRRLASFFPPAQQTAAAGLSAELLRFEYLADKQSVRMVMDCRLRFQGKEKVFRYDGEEKAEGPDMKDAAEAFERCILSLGRRLTKEIKGDKK
jgi:hypothetical protein